MCKSINVIQHRNESKYKISHEHLNRWKESLWQSLMLLSWWKPLMRVGEEEANLSHARQDYIWLTYSWHHAKVRNNSFSLDQKQKILSSLSPLLFKTVLQFLARTREGNKGDINRKEDITASFLMVLFYTWRDKKSAAENPQNWSRVEGYKINIQTSVAYLHTNNKHTEKNQGNDPIPNSLKIKTLWK